MTTFRVQGYHHHLNAPAPASVAIADELEKLYGHQDSFWDDGIDIEPLEAIEVFENHSGKSHWHYITRGLSDLRGEHPTGDYVGKSGFGFELTFRLPKRPTERTPKGWPMELLTWLARQVFDTGAYVEIGHQMSLGEAGTFNSKKSLCSIVFAADPQMSAVSSASGNVRFIQVIGLTLEQQDQVASSDPETYIKKLAGEDSLLLTHGARKLLLC